MTEKAETTNPIKTMKDNDPVPDVTTARHVITDRPVYKRGKVAYLRAVPIWRCTLLVLALALVVSMQCAVAESPAALDLESEMASRGAPKRSAPEDLPQPSVSVLRVPVFPTAPDMPAVTIDDVANGYIVLDDGAVLTVRDWVLGALNKDMKGHQMTDYDNRLFLGQVARAAAGLDQTLVDRTPGAAGPPRRYTEAVPTAGQAFGQAVVGALCMILCGPPDNTSLARGISGGGFNPANTVKPAGQLLTWLGEDWFAQDMQAVTLDFKDAGILKTMVKDAERTGD